MSVLLHSTRSDLNSLVPDYGCNNGDVEYEYKLESNRAYVNFLREKRDESTNLTLMARRAAEGKGVYGVKVLDFTRQPSEQLLSDEAAGLEPDVSASPTKLSNRSVAVFLLDVRSNKTPWPRNWKKYLVDYDADFLGEEQWAWFEEALNRSTATMNVIVQGLQVHADRYFDGNTVESWSRFPASQHRLYQTILRSDANSPILVSGDVHMAELLQKDCRQAGRFDKQESRTLLEVTTSGMTHSWGTNICARPTSSLACQSPHVAFSLKAGMHLAHNNYAWTDLVYESDPLDGAKAGFQYALDRNFGELELDWDNQQVLVRFFGNDTVVPLISTSWTFDELSKEQRPIDPPKVHRSDLDQMLQNLIRRGSANADDWICINHGGHPSFFLKLFGVLSPVFLAGSIMIAPVALPLLAILVLARRRSVKTL